MFDELDDLLQDLTLEPTTKKVKTVKLQDGERRIVSILFADIKGFTSLSEKLDPEQVRNILDKLLKLFSNCIEKHGGYIDKYEGDLVMALFGAKSANENDTERAIHTALEMLEKLGQFNSVLKKIPLTKNLNVELGLRIGINTGLVTTGKIGLEREGDFTVYGDAVNLASRMESNAPTNRIMISEESKKLVEDWFDFEGEKEIVVKGKSKKVKVFLVKSTKEKKLPKWIQHKRSVFVGRDKELAFLENSYQKVLQNLEEKQTGEEIKPIVIGLKGVAGLGKSRLAYEFLKLKLKDSPYRNLSVKGFCSNVSTSPYSMFTTLIKNYFGITLLDSKELIREKLENGFQKLESFLEDESEKENLRNSLPIIGFILGLKYDDVRLELKGRDLQIHIQIAIRYFLENTSSRANKLGFPFLVVFEDLHWMEESSTSALNFLLQTLNFREKKGLRPLKQILFILLYRPEYKIHKTILSETEFQEMGLSAFDPNTSMELIKSVFGEIEIPEKARNLLLEKSSGNPFYVEEWIEFVRSKDLVVFEEGNLTLKETEIPVPQSLSALILSRLDSLETKQKVLLQKASVIGREFSVQILSEVEKKFGETEGLPSKLEELEHNDFIQVLMNISEYYIFNHIITQEVAYNSLLISNRKILHKIIAETIEEKFQEVLESFYSELAIHYDKAEETEKAVEFLKKAGDQAKNNFENHKAIEFYDRLLENLKSLPNLKGLEIDTLLQKGIVLEIIGKWEESEEISRKALKLSEKIGDKIRIAESNNDLGFILYLRNKLDQALECFEKKLRFSEEANDKKGISNVSSRIGYVYSAQNFFDKSMEYHKRSLENYKELGYYAGIAHSTVNLALTFHNKGENYKAMEIYKKAIELYKKLGSKNGVLSNTGNLGLVYLDLGDYDKASKCFEKFFNFMEETGNKSGMANAFGYFGTVSYYKGNFVEAIEYREKSIRICEEIGDKFGASRAAVNIGMVYLDLGDYDKALKCCEKNLKIFEQLNNQSLILWTIGIMGRIFLKQGNYVKALEFFEKSLKISKKLDEKDSLSHQLFYKAKTFFLLKSYKEAKTLNLESLKVASEIGEKYMIFRTTLLSSKIDFALGDQTNPPKELQKLLTATEKKEEIATLNYELWKMLGEENYKIEALKLYKEFYSKTPKFEFKQKIKEMEDK